MMSAYVQTPGDPRTRAMTAQRERVLFWLTIGAIGLAIAIRLVGLDYSLWLDEIASVVFAQQPVSRLWSDWMIRETNPPLFYTILHYWIGLFGQSDLAVKSLATVFGIANIVVVALIARRLGKSWGAALVVTLFVALNPYHIFYSQNGRAFTLAAFAASVACLALVRIIEKHESETPPGGAPTDWALYTVASLAALYSHTTMIVFCVAVTLMIAGWMATARNRRQLLAAWMASNLVIGLGYAWWAWITWHQLGTNDNLDWMDEIDLRLAARIVIVIFAPRPSDLPVGAAVLFLASLVLIGARRRWGAVVATLATLSLVLFYLASQHTPIMQKRTVLWIYPLFAIALGLGAIRIRQRALAILLVALPLLLSILAYRQTFRDREWDRWPDTVALAATNPTVPVVVTNEAFALAFGHYCNRRFGRCPIRVIPAETSEDSIWSTGLSGWAVLPQRQAWSTAGPVVRTIEWDGVDTLFPQARGCSATDRSPAYVAQDVQILGQQKMTTWQRRAECSGG